MMQNKNNEFDGEMSSFFFDSQPRFVYHLISSEAQGRTDLLLPQEPRKTSTQPESRTWIKFIPKYDSCSRVFTACLRPGKTGPCALGSPMPLSPCSKSPDSAWDQWGPAVPSGRCSLSLAMGLLCSLSPLQHSECPSLAGQGQKVTLESWGWLQ